MLEVAHILCLAAPGSAAPAQALPLARRLDAALHMLPHPLLADSKGAVDEAVSTLGEKAPSVSIRRPADPPASIPAIRQYVAGEGIDLVVTDTPSDRGPVPPLATEATSTLLRQLPCPVFVVEQERRPGALRDLFVPTDLSDPSLSAVRHALYLARLYDAAVHVLHVVDSPPYVALTPTDRLSLGPRPLPEHRGQRRVKAFLRDAGAADVPLHPHLAYGDPTDQILRFIDRIDVGLVVLASHGQAGPGEPPFGQVATRLLGRTTHPVFLVRAAGPSLLTASADEASDLPSE